MQDNSFFYFLKNFILHYHLEVAVLFFEFGEKMYTKMANASIFAITIVNVWTAVLRSVESGPCLCLFFQELNNYRFPAGEGHFQF